jgi:hypothetical protein
MQAFDDAEQRFVLAPQAVLDKPGFRVSFPSGGLPMALDPAASSMLDCFEEPLSPRELADDLAAALDMDEKVAERTARTLTNTLLRSGQVIPDGLIPMPTSYLSYPPAASPCLLGRVRFERADTFSLEIGGLRFRVVSEIASLRERVVEATGLEPGGRPYREGLLLGRPAAEATVGSGMWVLYETGSIVLRRSADEEAVTRAACFHLIALGAAVASPLLPLRLRPILLGDGTAILVDPEAIHLVPGHERRLARRGILVLPTTMALVDPATRQLRLPEQQLDPAIPTGTVPIGRILLNRRDEPDLPDAEPILALARTVLRDPDRDLQQALDHIDDLAHESGLIEFLPRPEILRTVENLGRDTTG